MRAAHPLPTNSSRSAGRNRRGVIQSTFRSVASRKLGMVSRLNTCRRGGSLTCAATNLPNVRPFRYVQSRGGTMAWWKRAKSEPDEAAADPALPLLRFEGISKIFKADGGADETDTYALNDVTVDIDRG